jgi:hypothetical protein
MDEMEQVNGGVDRDFFIATTGSFAGLGAIGGAAVAFGLSGPVGWCVLGGAAICGGIAAAINLAKDGTL